ncbi:hypothetical protein [Acaryochloris sp. 'Moss Beach']|nr:hypothetical protein [Acaryochloris sp. 'Moss Beach']
MGIVVCDRTHSIQNQHKLIRLVPTPGTIKILVGRRQLGYDH